MLNRRPGSKEDDPLRLPGIPQDHHVHQAPGAGPRGGAQRPGQGAEIAPSSICFPLSSTRRDSPAIFRAAIRSPPPLPTNLIGIVLQGSSTWLLEENEGERTAGGNGPIGTRTDLPGSRYGRVALRCTRDWEKAMCVFRVSLWKRLGLWSTGATAVSFRGGGGGGPTDRREGTPEVATRRQPI